MAQRRKIISLFLIAQRPGLGVAIRCELALTSENNSQ
jgi:hypothetical protein